MSLEAFNKEQSRKLMFFLFGREELSEVFWWTSEEFRKDFGWKKENPWNPGFWCVLNIWEWVKTISWPVGSPPAYWPLKMALPHKTP